MLKKNDDIPLGIDSLTSEGSGIGRHGGMAVFVPGSAPGDELICHIIKVKKNYAIGKIKEIIKESPDRTETDCPVFPKCGGCAFRHITYEAELRAKERRVRDALERIGGIKAPSPGIAGADGRSRYRNKAQYPVRQAPDGRLLIGFYASGTHRVVECGDCLLQPREFAGIVKLFAGWMKEYGVSAYDEETGKGLVRHLYLRRGFKTGQIMVMPVINGRSLPRAKELAALLTGHSPDIKSFCVCFNTADSNVILGTDYEVICGSDGIEDELCGIRVKISPLSFFQVNPVQTEKLYSIAAAFAEPDKTKTVLDLYCGAGTIGLSMAGQAKRIIGAEIVPEAVKDAKINAELNGIRNAEFICADAAEAADALAARGIKPDVIILDPPRKGCSRELLGTAAQMAPERIVYVSCDPATLARDAAILTEKGYPVQKYTPVDMFPGTVHVETVCLLRKQ